MTIKLKKLAPDDRETKANTSFVLDGDLIFSDLFDTIRTGVAHFWCTGPFTIEPHEQTITIDPPDTKKTVPLNMKLVGTAPTQPTLVEVWVECAERHSVHVKVVP